MSSKRIAIVPAPASNPSVQLNPEQHARIKEYCTATKTSVRATISEAIDDFLNIVAPARLSHFEKRRTNR